MSLTTSPPPQVDQPRDWRNAVCSAFIQTQREVISHYRCKNVPTAYCTLRTWALNEDSRNLEQDFVRHNGVLNSISRVHRAQGYYHNKLLSQYKPNIILRLSKNPWLVINKTMICFLFYLFSFFFPLDWRLGTGKAPASILIFSVIFPLNYNSLTSFPQVRQTDSWTGWSQRPFGNSVVQWFYEMSLILMFQFLTYLNKYSTLG